MNNKIKSPYARIRLFHCDINNPTPLDLGIESLESRRMLAGNVVATLTESGDLLVTGDNEDNDIAVLFDEFGNATVEGYSGTTVDQSGVTGIVTGNVLVRMRGGDDSVQIQGSPISSEFGFSDNVEVRAGSGDDFVGIEDMQINGSVRVVGASGDDVTSIREVEISGDTEVLAGSGYDDIHARGVFGGNVVFRSGAGDDLITVNYDTSIAGAMTIDTSSGNDSISALYLDADSVDVFTRGGNDSILIGEISVSGRVNLNGGSGHNFVQFGRSEIGSLQVRSGGEDDFIQISDATMSGDLSIVAGDGVNDIQVKYSSIGGDGLISTGGEDDVIEIRETNAKYGGLEVNAGAGEDSIVAWSVASGSLEVNAGNGADYLYAKYAYAANSDIRMGGGADRAQLLASSLGDFEIRMNGGDDELRFADVTGNGIAHGGLGIDDLEIIGSPNLDVELIDF